MTMIFPNVSFNPLSTINQKTQSYIRLNSPKLSIYQASCFFFNTSILSSSMYGLPKWMYDLVTNSCLLSKTLYHGPKRYKNHLFFYYNHTTTSLHLYYLFISKELFFFYIQDISNIVILQRLLYTPQCFYNEPELILAEWKTPGVAKQHATSTPLETKRKLALCLIQSTMTLHFHRVFFLFSAELASLHGTTFSHHGISFSPLEYKNCLTETLELLHYSIFIHYSKYKVYITS